MHLLRWKIAGSEKTRPIQVATALQPKSIIVSLVDKGDVLWRDRMIFFQYILALLMVIVCLCSHKKTKAIQNLSFGWMLFFFQVSEKQQIQDTSTLQEDGLQDLHDIDDDSDSDSSGQRKDGCQTRGRHGKTVGTLIGKTLSTFLSME